nr:vacuolar protein-sorting protein bro1-like [Ipomoea batatas]
MGKAEEEQPLPIAGEGELRAHQNAENRRCCWRIRHDIVASFMLEKPVSLLEDHILQLEDEILDEISVSNTKVDILSLETSALSNKTKVVFAVDSDVKSTSISPTAKALIQDNFVYILIHQSNMSLTTASLFGNPASFEVLKFKGGIAVAPLQKAFTLQKVQIVFNFTLNFSIEELQVYFDELTQQLKSGLHLSPSEGLDYKEVIKDISAMIFHQILINPKGSTVDPPTIVRSQVFLVVGVPSKSRQKQLAQTITGSHEKNLGLNHTVFGRVKQVSLSSTVNGSAGDSNFAPPISPSPTPKSAPVNWRQSPIPVPALAPAPVPNPHKIHKAEPPAPPPFGPNWRSPTKEIRHRRMPPVASPVSAPNVAPFVEPKREASAPSPHNVRTSRPLPNVVYAVVPPPSMSISDAEPPDKTHSISHFSSSGKRNKAKTRELCSGAGGSKAKSPKGHPCFRLSEYMCFVRVNTD